MCARATDGPSHGPGHADATVAAHPDVGAAAVRPDPRGALDGPCSHALAAAATPASPAAAAAPAAAAIRAAAPAAVAASAAGGSAISAARAGATFAANRRPPRGGGALAAVQAQPRRIARLGRPG